MKYEIHHKKWVTFRSKIYSDDLEKLLNFKQLMQILTKAEIRTNPVFRKSTANLSIEAQTGQYLFDDNLLERLENGKIIQLDKLAIEKVSNYIGSHDLTLAQPTFSQQDAYYAPGEDIPKYLQELIDIGGYKLLAQTSLLAQPNQNTHAVSQWLCSLVDYKAQLNADFINFSYKLAKSTSLSFASKVNQYLTENKVILNSKELNSIQKTLMEIYSQDSSISYENTEFEFLLKPKADPVCFARNLDKFSAMQAKKEQEKEDRATKGPTLKRHGALFL